jgi:hypothetical protein
MEELMNHEVQELINKAAKIIEKTGNKPGTRYPKNLKKMVTSLRLDHNMSVRDITKYVGVSSYSAREWPKNFQQKIQFNKISVTNNKDKKVQTKIYFKELQSIIFNQRVLIVLITLLIFESIMIHLIL